MEEVIKYIAGLLISAATGYVAAIRRENKSLKQGMRAMLRDSMIKGYNRYYEDKGYMPIYARESFEALYKSYHDLGGNGVIDDMYKKVISLPTSQKGGYTHEN